MMFCWFALALLALVPVVTGNNAGIKVAITQRGLDYAVINAIMQVLMKMEIPDLNGTKEVPVFGNVEYSFTGLKISFEKFESVQKFVSGTGVSIAVQSTKLQMSGYMTLGRNRTFDVFVTSLSINATVAVKSDKTDHPTFSMNDCAAEIGPFEVRPQNRWVKAIVFLLNLFVPSFTKKMICSQLTTALGYLNTQLARLNANVNEYAEIDYSLRSVYISDTSIELGLKGVFYNTQQRKEPPFSPTAFSLASQNTKMFYIAVSAFTINSAFLVHHNAGVFSIRITDDMIPSVSPIRLSTATFGALIPQISKTFPDLKLELEVKTVKEPVIKFKPKNVILELLCTVRAHSSQPNNTPTQLFVINLEGSASVEVYVTEDKLALELTLEKIEVSMKESNAKTYENNNSNQQFTKINFLNMDIKDIVFPIIKAHLAKGFPLPGLLGSTTGKLHFVNPQVEVFKDYVLIGTDIQFGENTSS